MSNKLHLDCKVNVGYSDELKPILINQVVLDEKVYCLCFELNLLFVSALQFAELYLSVPVNFFVE